MDNRAIGVFDSGVGGLTCVKQLIQILPQENIIYFGDTGRVPYGTKSVSTVLRYARQDVRFLKTFPIKAIAVACGTVSSTALPELKQENDIPILGVLEPAAEAAVRATRSGRIGVVGTKATIRSGSYDSAILHRMPNAQLISLPCPLLVPLAEEGRTSESDPIAREAILEYFSPLKEAKVDTIVLGCTHYPLFKRAIGQFVGDDVTLIDPGKECALALASLLKSEDSLNGSSESGCVHYFSSDSVSDFVSAACLFLGSDIAGGVMQIQIEQY